MSEKLIKPISQLLPRGVMAEVARRVGLSRTAIKMVADGKLDKPDIYHELLKVAEIETERRKAENVLREENLEKAKKLSETVEV